MASMPGCGTATGAATPPAGTTTATVTTVGDFLQMRAEREKRWRNNQKRRR